MANVLRFENVSKIYPGPPSVQAVKDVTLSLNQGDFAAFIGPSGSGKTTLLNLAAGFDLATSGAVQFLSQSIASFSAAELCKLRQQHMGFVFQAYNLFPTLTAVENVEYTCLIRGDRPKIARQWALEALSMVGLPDFASRFPNQLSGGQQQRVAVARALCAQPKVVFADEPTANLDSESALGLIELFGKLNREKGVAFLFSTHDHRLISQISRKFYVEDGRLDGNHL